jgi:hypothetical protein
VKLRTALALLATIVSLAWQLTPTTAQPSCQFVLGFATLRELVGADTVGDCLEDEHFNPDNGNAEQRTTGGLLVWRKIDNFMLFTDGGTSWVNGPSGLQSRPNSERFSWEGDPVSPAPSTSSPGSSSDPYPPSSSAPPLIVLATAPPTSTGSGNPPGSAVSPSSTSAPTPTLTPSSSSAATATPSATPRPSSTSSGSSASGRADPVGGECPATHLIKGATTSTGQKLFYEPDRPEYRSVTPEVCFSAGGDARDAGYVSSKR